MPSSDVPGEIAWPTQPFPTRPPAFEAQGVSLDDAFNLTPELQQAAQAELKRYRLGPLYTPPSAEGTVVRPGVWGGANWGGGAFDPETGRSYLKTAQSLGVFAIRKFDPAEQPADRKDEVDADYVQRSLPPVFMNGIPLTNPPYAHLVWRWTSIAERSRGGPVWRHAGITRASGTGRRDAAGDGSARRDPRGPS